MTTTDYFLDSITQSLSHSLPIPFPLSAISLVGGTSMAWRNYGTTIKMVLLEHPDLTFNKLQE